MNNKSHLFTLSTPNLKALFNTSVKLGTNGDLIGLTSPELAHLELEPPCTGSQPVSGWFQR